jgi:predicted dehydrogenase
MARLRTAVIGVGHLGKEHARILAGLPDVELVGVADTNAELARGVAARLGCQAYADSRPLVGGIDAAVVAVPTPYHHAVAAELLARGLPLLVEKPLAATLEEAEDLVGLAQRHGTLLQVGHIERFNPAWEECERYALQPKFVQAERLGPFTGRSADTGVVLDLMIHDLDLLLARVGAPVRTVEALGIALFGRCEDVANARLTFANGCVADLTATRASFVSRRSMQLWSPEGYAAVDFGARRLTLVQPSDELRRHGLDPARLDPAARATVKDDLFRKHFHVLERDCSGGSDALTRELQHFVQCVRTGRRPRAGGEEGRDAIALATRVVTALERHAWQGEAVGPIGPTERPEPLGRWFQPPGQQAAA